jgi:hypothetical protein
MLLYTLAMGMEEVHFQNTVSGSEAGNFLINQLPWKSTNI